QLCPGLGAQAGRTELAPSGAQPLPERNRFGSRQTQVESLLCHGRAACPDIRGRWPGLPRDLFQLRQETSATRNRRRDEAGAVLPTRRGQAQRRHPRRLPTPLWTTGQWLDLWQWLDFWTFARIEGFILSR